MNQRTNIIPPDVEYHRVLAGEKRRIGRGILAIMLLIGGMMFFSLVLAAIAAAVNAAMGVDGPAANNPLIYATGMLSLALLIPWSMLIQRWLYGVKGRRCTRWSRGSGSTSSGGRWLSFFRRGSST